MGVPIDGSRALLTLVGTHGLSDAAVDCDVLTCDRSLTNFMLQMTGRLKQCTRRRVSARLSWWPWGVAPSSSRTGVSSPGRWRDWSGTILLEHRFDTFMDVENLDSGEFPRAILSQIEAREHFIVLLQPGSLDHIGEDGDWLRREIAHALAHGRNVVPVTATGSNSAATKCCHPTWRGWHRATRLPYRRSTSTRR